MPDDLKLYFVSSIIPARQLLTICSFVPMEECMHKFNKISLLGVVLVLSGILTACGGGGGGSAGLSYTGVTTAAVISNSNAETLALESFTSGTDASSTQAAASTVAVVNATSRKPDAGLLASRLFRSTRIASQELLTTSAGSGPRTLVSIQREMTPLSGSCGGSSLGSLTIDDVTSDVYASIVFSKYCEGGVTLSGSMDFSLILDTASTDYGLMTMNYNNVRVSDGVENVAMSGSMSFDLMASDPTVTINLLMQDPAGKVYKMQNFVITMVSDIDTTGEYLDVSMEGRLYDPDYGYVDLSTTLPMRVYMTDDWPSSGVYVLTGEGGATVTLTASPSGYLADVDLDGDSTVDNTLTGNWVNT
jgi:hypothetical protein